MTLQILACAEGLNSCNTPAELEKVSTRTEVVPYGGGLAVPANSFVVARVKRHC